MTLDMSACLRDSIMAEPAIIAKIGEWKDEPAIFTRRPIPEDAPARCIVIPPAAAIGDADGLTSSRPVVMRDIIVYGNQPDDYRVVEEIGFLLRTLFHRQKFSTVPSGFAVIDIQAQGPRPAPVDDDKTVARMVNLTIRLREN